MMPQTASSAQQPAMITKTDSLGRVALSLPLTAADRQDAAWNNGTLNLAVLVQQPGGAAPEMWNFSRSLNTSTFGAPLGPRALQLLPGGVTRHWSGGVAYMQSASATSSQISSMQLPATTTTPNLCLTLSKADGSTVAWTKVGALHNTSDATATFQYGKPRIPPSRSVILQMVLRGGQRMVPYR